MSHKFKPPKSPRKKVYQMPSPGPQIRLGLPRASGETAQKIIGKIAQDGDFSSVDELNAHLQRLTASGELNRMIQAPPESPAEQAQELAYQAMEEPSCPKARKLAEKALKLDPACIDALVIRTQTRRLKPAEVKPSCVPQLKRESVIWAKKYSSKSAGVFGESWRRVPICALAASWHWPCLTPGNCRRQRPSSQQCWS